jgi:DNA polymerase-3 subunit epsilon
LYAIIDIETTGNSYKIGKITEIAIYIHDGFNIIDTFSTLVNPECYISDFITRLTGIDNSMVRNAPRFYEVARKIVEMTADKIFVAHNVSFDYKFIKEEFSRLGYDYQRTTMCTVRMGRKYIPGYRSYSLGNICGELGISINGRHRAAGDALATVKLFEIILQRKALKEARLDPNQLSMF